MGRLYLVLALVACSAHQNKGDDGPDASVGDPCSGNATRCEGNAYQTCVDGTFMTQTACSGTCSDTLGCIDCDPASSQMTCNGNSVVTCNADGTFGTTVTTCGNGQMCADGACSNVCTADGVDLVYVVDEQNDFMSFDPRKLPGDPFTLIGTLSCPTTGASIQTGNPTVMPFSMSVDRDGVAWVLYTSGELFKVSLQTAACTAAGNTVGAGGMQLFGMGFVTDTAGADTEKLYLAGGNNDPQATPHKLAYDDTHGGNLTPTSAGTSPRRRRVLARAHRHERGEALRLLPEPDERRVRPGDQQDRRLGGRHAVEPRHDRPRREHQRLGVRPVGRHVLHLRHDVGRERQNRNSTVRAIDRMTNTYTTVLQNLPYYIDGAGVSTCAPVVDRVVRAGMEYAARVTSIAVVTGAGRGLGRCIAERLARSYHVFVTDIDEIAAAATAAAIGGTPFAQDVRDPDSHRAIAKAAQQRGRLSVWVNNAGVLAVGDAWQMTDAEIRRMVEINLLGVIWGCNAALARDDRGRDPQHRLAVLADAGARARGLRGHQARRPRLLAVARRRARPREAPDQRLDAVPRRDRGRHDEGGRARSGGRILFSSGQLTLDEVADEAVALIDRPRLVSALPAYRAAVIHALRPFPRIGLPLMEQLAKLGRRRRTKAP